MKFFLEIQVIKIMQYELFYSMIPQEVVTKYHRICLNGETVIGDIIM